MIKLRSIKSIIGWLIIAMFFFLMIFILHKLQVKIFIFYALFAGLSLLSLSFIFIAQTKIIIDNDNKKIYLTLTPLIDPALNKDKRHKKDEWNNNINLNDVKNYAIRKLSKEDKINFLGSKFIFNKYLIVETLEESNKYLYIAMFSKKQINFIVNILRENIK